MEGKVKHRESREATPVKRRRFEEHSRSVADQSVLQDEAHDMVVSRVGFAFPRDPRHPRSEDPCTTGFQSRPRDRDSYDTEPGNRPRQRGATLAISFVLIGLSSHISLLELVIFGDI